MVFFDLNTLSYLINYDYKKQIYTLLVSESVKVLLKIRSNHLMDCSYSKNFEDLSVSILRKIAQRTDLPADLYELMAKDKNDTIKSELAMNPNVNSSALKLLSKDKNWSTRQSVAEHHLTSKDILVELANDSNFSVRKSVAKNQNCPQEILLKLVCDVEPEVILSAKLSLILLRRNKLWLSYL